MTVIKPHTRITIIIIIISIIFIFLAFWQIILPYPLFYNDNWHLYFKSASTDMLKLASYSNSDTIVLAYGKQNSSEASNILVYSISCDSTINWKVLVDSSKDSEYRRNIKLVDITMDGENSNYLLIGFDDTGINPPYSELAPQMMPNYRIVKIGENGTILWDNMYYSAEEIQMEPRTFTINNNNDIFVACTAKSISGYFDNYYYLIKIMDDGSNINEYSFENILRGECWDMNADRLGNIYLAGMLYYNEQGITEDAACLIKLDERINIEWISKKMGTIDEAFSTKDAFTSIIISNDGGSIFCAGIIKGELYNEGDLEFQPKRYSFVAEYDENGAEVWQKIIYSNDINFSFDLMGNTDGFIMDGTFGGNGLYCSDTDNDYTLVDTQLNENHYYIKYNTEGKIIDFITSRWITNLLPTVNYYYACGIYRNTLVVSQYGIDEFGSIGE